MATTQANHRRLTSRSPGSDGLATLPVPMREGADAKRASDSLSLQIMELGAAIERRMASALSPFNVTPAEFRILAVLERRGPSTAAQVAKCTPIDPSFISRTVQRLAEKGLLSRRRSRTDRRTVTLRPSPEGDQLLEQLHEPMLELEADIVNGLSRSDLRTVSGVVDAMTSNGLHPNGS